MHDWQEQLKQTEVAQPAICLASLLRLEQLTRLGVTPAAVGGHSLGELTACYAAGAYSGEELLRFAALRGQAMAASSSEQAGTMASLVCSAEKAQVLLHAVLGSQSTGKAEKGYAVVANKNSPSQTVFLRPTIQYERDLPFCQKSGHPGNSSSCCQCLSLTICQSGGSGAGKIMSSS